MFHKVLVALDNSDISSRVFSEALALAQATRAKLMLLHVLSPFENTYPTMSVVPGMDAYHPMLYNAATDEYLKRWEVLEQHELELLRQRAPEAMAVGVTTEFTQKSGDPGRVICAIAHTWAADLIIMGRRGRSGLSEFMLGSVSNYVLHHAPCSVCVVQGQSASKTTSSQKQTAITR